MAEPAAAEVKIEPAVAREYVGQFVHDPAIVKGMPDDKVLEYHGRVRTAVDGAVQAAIKERGDWGPDWRKTIAGDKADLIPTLERFKTPKDIFESYTALRTKVSNGELKAISPFPANGTEEQKAAWRTESGLPADPKGYKIEPPAGVVIGEDDKPIIDGFATYAHSKNLSNDAVNAAVAWWGEEKMKREEHAAAHQAELRAQVDDQLHNEWGPDFRPTMNRIEGLLQATLDTDSPMQKAIMESVATSAEFANWIGKIAFQLNPSGAGIILGEEGQLKSVQQWLETGDKLMRSDRKAYNKSEYADSAKYKANADAYKAQTGKEWGK